MGTKNSVSLNLTGFPVHMALHHTKPKIVANYKTISLWLVRRKNRCYTQKRSLGGARGVVVITVGNEYGDSSSNPGRYWLHFT